MQLRGEQVTQIMKREGKSTYLYAKRSGLQTAKSGWKLKQQLCALSGLGGTDHSHLPRQDCTGAVC